MPIVRGIDSDNWDGPVPQSHYRRLYDEFAMRFNILGLEAQMPFVQAQKQASQEAGLWVPFGYKFLYWVPTDIERMKQACAAQLPIFVDCETPTNWQPARVVERIHMAKDALLQEGFYGGIYSAPGWWRSATGDYPGFNADPWWHASWPYGNGVLPPPSYLPTGANPPGQPNWIDLQDIPQIGMYAGRRYVDCWQYANTCYLDELGDWDFDMNAMWMDDDPAPPQPVPPAPDYVTGMRLYFKSGTEWNLEVLPPPDQRGAGQNAAALQLHHHP